MKDNDVNYRERRQTVADSMIVCESAMAETKFVELLGSRIDQWPADELGWLIWLRTRPASRLIMGRAGGGSCFIFSPSEHAGYWAVLRQGFRGQGMLTSSDVVALEEIATQKGIRGA